MNNAKQIIKGLVSVLIVNWNGKHFLDGCFTTLFAQTYKNFEVIMVDNASKDGSIEYTKEKYPQIKLVLNDENYGFAKGNRIGLDYCKGEYIFLLNNDTELHPDVLKNLVEALQPENVGGVCGKIMSLTNKEKCIFTLPKINSLTGKAVWINEDSEKCKVDYLSGNSLMMKKSIIDKIGFLDEAYFAYFEETDLCARMIRAGYDLMYIPEVIVWHKEMGSTPSWFNKYYMMRNQIRFILKNFDVKYIPFALKYNILKAIKTLKSKTKTEEANAQNPNAPNSSGYNIKKLLIKAIFWNIFFLPQTIYCRNRDFKRIGKSIRSYNENLPLRNIKNDI